MRSALDDLEEQADQLSSAMIADFLAMTYAGMWEFKEADEIVALGQRHASVATRSQTSTSISLHWSGARDLNPGPFYLNLSSFRGLASRFQGSFIHECRLNYYMNYYMVHVRGGAIRDRQGMRWRLILSISSSKRTPQLPLVQLGWKS
jgi:hypothetical protein